VCGFLEKLATTGGRCSSEIAHHRYQKGVDEPAEGYPFSVATDTSSAAACNPGQRHFCDIGPGNLHREAPIKQVHSGRGCQRSAGLREDAGLACQAPRGQRWPVGQAVWCRVPNYQSAAVPPTAELRESESTFLKFPHIVLLCPFWRTTIAFISVVHDNSVSHPGSFRGAHVDGQSQDRTPASMFSRLRHLPQNEADRCEFERTWCDFVATYGPMIYSWCCHWGLQDAANDVTQDVLTRFINALPDFKYDPSKGKFRGWLKTVTVHVLDDLRDERRKSIAVSQNDSLLLALEGLEAREDLADRLAKQYDLELLEEAKSCVRNQVESRTWDIYFRTVECDEAAPAVAAALGMRIANVYKAKSNVTKKIRETYQHLEEQENQS
jgi:DNA-directed RNA polymerase specialized sigma24 family protein